MKNTLRACALCIWIYAPLLTVLLTDHLFGIWASVEYLQTCYTLQAIKKGGGAIATQVHSKN